MIFITEVLVAFSRKFNLLNKHGFEDCHRTNRRTAVSSDQRAPKNNNAVPFFFN